MGRGRHRAAGVRRVRRRDTGQRRVEGGAEGRPHAGSDFARIWSAHDVASPGPHIKVLRYAEVGDLRLTTTTLTVTGAPEARLVIYAPADEASKARLAHLAEHPSRHCSLPDHLHEPGGTADDLR
ncbi:hypothetical protein ACIA8R_33460 [Nonomuraea sp. NPDC051191]|uniref:MmyB family transcriptional regulator n=1 Tax=Nonomuraea sp. NPDC051191 TaxID=3364372 RepID=UPI003795450D